MLQPVQLGSGKMKRASGALPVPLQPETNTVSEHALSSYCQVDAGTAPKRNKSTCKPDESTEHP